MDLALLFGRGTHPPYQRSVLPRIEAKPTSEGMSLTVLGAGRRKAWQLVYYGSVAVLMFALPFLLHKAARGMRAYVFGISVVIIFFTLLTEYLRWRHLRRATLAVHPWPLKFGEPVEARFRIFMRGGAPVSALAAKIECVEQVMIGAGKDATRRQAVRYQAPLDADAQTDRRHLTATWKFVLPDGHPQSLDVPSNKVIWRLTATVSTDDVEIPVEFELLVVPEVVAA